MDNSNICPICKKTNSCSVDNFDSCWCLDIKVPKELFDFIPLKSRNKACVCKECVLRFKNKDKLFFKSMKK